MDQPIEYVKCPTCTGVNGPQDLTGVLGQIAHYYCRYCGISFYVNLEDAPDPPPDPNINRESKYFEIFARRDPGVGIKDVYEKVSFEYGLCFEDSEDLEMIRGQLIKVFTEIYGGFKPIILFDFEPHDYYKPNDQTPEDPETWYTVTAVEKGEDGRELTIVKPPDLDSAVTHAKLYDDRGHGYAKILVRRQPDLEIVWDSTDQDAPDNAPDLADLDLPFDQEEMLIILETARLALADEDISVDIGEKMNRTYDQMIGLHDKIVKYTNNWIYT